MESDRSGRWLSTAFGINVFNLIRLASLYRDDGPIDFHPEDAPRFGLGLTAALASPKYRLILLKNKHYRVPFKNDFF